LKKIGGFDVKGYQNRLRMLREIVTNGGTQQELADKLEIPMKRWNNYERGYPVPREVAFLLKKTFPDVSVEWLWFGMTGNLSSAFLEKIKELEKFERERELARSQLKKAKDRVKNIDAEREKVISPRRR
jgi:transcriptional regulator with XRE-family HTH domain